MHTISGLLDECLLLSLLPAASLQLLEVFFLELSHRESLIHQVLEALLVVAVMHEELGFQGLSVLEGPLEVYYVVDQVLHRKYTFTE